MSREMKHSGIAWLGKIPNCWNVLRLKNLGFLYGGLTGKSGDDFVINEDEPCSYMYFIPFTNIFNNDVIDTKQLYKVKTEEGEQQNLVNKFDILFLMSSEDNDGVGKPAIIEEQVENLGLNSFCKGLRITNNQIYPKFLYYLLSSHIIRELIRQEARGFIRINLRQDKLSCCPIFLPPLAEQKAIADFLDKKCGEIDELVALQGKIIEELKAYKHSVITEAVCKGLNPNIPMKDSGVEWIEKMPIHWEIRRLKYIGKSENGLTYSPNDLCDNSNDGILVLRSSNIQEGKLVFTDNVYVKDAPSILHVKKGDIILCSRNGSAALVGKSAIVNSDIYATFGAFMMRFRSNHHTEYIHYLLTAAVSQYKQLFSTTTINQLTIGVFGNLEMPFVVSRIEQQEIADYLDKKCSEIDQLISIKQQKIVELKDYKKSLIYEYTTGKKRVEA